MGGEAVGKGQAEGQRYGDKETASRHHLLHDVAHWGTLIQQPQLASLVGLVSRVTVDASIQHGPVEVTH